MDEPISVSCPHCQQRLSVSAENLGQPAECSLCGQTFTVQPNAAPNLPAVPSNPSSPLSSPSQGAVQPVTPLMAKYLLATGPWVRFLSVMGFIGCGLMVVAALAMMAVGGLAGRGGRGPELPVPGAVLGLIYLVLAGLYMVPACLLSSYASAIKRYRYSAASGDVEAALKSQKSFWKFMGIMTIVVMSFYLVGILIALVIGVSMGLR